MKNALKYSLKIWLFALLLSAIPSYFIWKLGNKIIAYVYRGQRSKFGLHYRTEMFETSNIGWALMRVIPYYLPYLAIIFMLTIYFQKQKTGARFKLRLSLLALLLTIYPFVFLDPVVDHVVFNEQLSWIISFASFVIIGIWIFSPDKSLSVVKRN